MVREFQKHGAPRSPNRRSSVLTGLLLILIGIAACSGGQSPAKPEETPAARPFAIGPYELEAPVAGLPGLVEWPASQYETMGRLFHGEKNYNASPVMFMGRQWELIVGTVDGKIYKLAPHTRFTDKLPALQTLEATLRFYRETLGEPTKPQPGLYIWDVPEANVILQQAEASDGFGIGLFLTAGSARTRATIPQ